MKKILLTLSALLLLGYGQGNARDITAPKDIVTRGMHPLEEKILENYSTQDDTFIVYYNSIFPSTPVGKAIFKKLTLPDTSYSALELFIPPLRKFRKSFLPSPILIIKSIFSFGIDKNYRSIVTSKDTLYCLNENSYRISDRNLMQFYEDLKKEISENPLEDYPYYYQQIYPYVVTDLKDKEDHFDIKRSDIGVDYIDIYNVFEKDYLLVKFFPLDDSLLKNFYFFISQEGEVPWMYIDLSPYHDFRIVSGKVEVNDKDPFYDIVKGVK